MSIFEILLNAKYNLQKNGMLGAEVAKHQIETVVDLIKEGKDIHDYIEEENKND